MPSLLQTRCRYGLPRMTVGMSDTFVSSTGATSGMRRGRNRRWQRSRLRTQENPDHGEVRRGRPGPGMPGPSALVHHPDHRRMPRSTSMPPVSDTRARTGSTTSHAASGVLPAQTDNGARVSPIPDRIAVRDRHRNFALAPGISHVSASSPTVLTPAGTITRPS